MLRSLLSTDQRIWARIRRFCCRRWLCNIDKILVSRFHFAKKLTLKVPLKHDDSDELAISTNKMNIIASQIAKMPRLQSLDLNDVNAKFIGIIANHETTNQCIKSLSVTSWESERTENDEDPYDELVASITAFKQLQFLKFIGPNDMNPERYDVDELVHRSLIITFLVFTCLKF